jgi:hypothetical protein
MAMIDEGLELPDTLQQCSTLLAEPFCIFDIAPFLDESFYERLRQDFPDPAAWEYASHQKGKKLFLNDTSPEFHRFLETSPAWATLFRSIANQRFVTHVQRFLGDQVAHRPPEDRHPWRFVDTRGARSAYRRVRRKVVAATSRGRRTPVTVALEFSVLQPGTEIPPHHAVPRKLVSLMLYFPTDAQAGHPALGTTFFRGRDQGPGWVEWASTMMDEDAAAAFFSAHEEFHRSDFVPNRLVGFVKNGVSWHAVPPIPDDAGPRRSVNINIMLDGPKVRTERA